MKFAFFPFWEKRKKISAPWKGGKGGGGDKTETVIGSFCGDISLYPCIFSLLVNLPSFVVREVEI